VKQLISIGMPVFNCSNYIDQSIISIINQSYTEWELIIIDDNSTDDTLDKIKKYNDSRIHLYCNANNMGLPSCLNECINISKGKYFARMDGDDIMINDRLEKQIEYLENNSSIDVVGGFAYVIDINNKIIGLRNSAPPRDLNELIKVQGYFIHPTVMGKIEWFIQNQYDDKIKRCQDFELWLRTYQSSSFIVLNEYLLFYREVGDNYKMKYYNVYLNLKNILNKHRGKLSSLYYFQSLSKAYLKYYLFDLLMYFGLLLPKQQIGLKEIEEIQKLLNKAINL
jgi:glycosyltransferase involved in cell wall biosynthesis